MAVYYFRSQCDFFIESSDLSLDAVERREFEIDRARHMHVETRAKIAQRDTHPTTVVGWVSFYWLRGLFWMFFLARQPLL